MTYFLFLSSQQMEQENQEKAMRREGVARGMTQFAAATDDTELAVGDAGTSKTSMEVSSQQISTSRTSLQTSSRPPSQQTPISSPVISLTKMSSQSYEEHTSLGDSNISLKSPKSPRVTVSSRLSKAYEDFKRPKTPKVRVQTPNSPTMSDGKLFMEMKSPRNLVAQVNGTTDISSSLPGVNRGRLLQGNKKLVPEMKVTDVSETWSYVTDISRGKFHCHRRMRDVSIVTDVSKTWSNERQRHLTDMTHCHSISENYLL